MRVIHTPTSYAPWTKAVGDLGIDLSNGWPTQLSPEQLRALDRLPHYKQEDSMSRTIDLATPSEPDRPGTPTYQPHGANRGERVQQVLDAIASGDTRGRTVAENVDTSPARTGFSAIDAARGLDGHVARQQEADLAEYRHQLASRTRAEKVDDILEGHALVSDRDLARRKADRIEAERNQNLRDISAALGRAI